MRSHELWIGALCAAVAGMASAASAQYATGFETADGIEASPDGVMLNGQDEFYNPDPPNSISALAYTYDGNAVGLPANPNGGSQFAAGTGPGDSIFVRSQRDVVYGDGMGRWSVCYDIAATFVGELPSAQNLGSVSTTDFGAGTHATFIALATWVDPDTAEAWNADYVWFGAAGNQILESVNDPAFQNLQTEHWYRWCTTFDLDTNQIVEVSITDLANGETATHEPVDRYLEGGEAGGLAAPVGFRLFAGATSAVPGNTLGFDNIDIAPTEPPCPADCNGDGVLNITDFLCFQTAWQDMTPFGDCNGDGAYDILDFLCYQTLFQEGCP